MVQTDFEAIESAWNCLGSIFEDCDVELEVEINSLGGPNTLKEYNKALTGLLLPKKDQFSPASQKRIESGHSLRILDSKSTQDQALIADIDLPHIDEFIDKSFRETFTDL